MKKMTALEKRPRAAHEEITFILWSKSAASHKTDRARSDFKLPAKFRRAVM